MNLKKNSRRASFLIAATMRDITAGSSVHMERCSEQVSPADDYHSNSQITIYCFAQEECTGQADLTSAACFSLSSASREDGGCFRRIVEDSSAIEDNVSTAWAESRANFSASSLPFL